MTDWPRYFEWYEIITWSEKITFFRMGSRVKSSSLRFRRGSFGIRGVIETKTFPLPAKNHNYNWKHVLVIEIFLTRSVALGYVWVLSIRRQSKVEKNIQKGMKFGSFFHVGKVYLFDSLRIPDLEYSKSVEQ